MKSIYSDGGARGNPGEAACAFVIKDDVGVVHGESKYLGVTTNNVAEYQGVLSALSWVVENTKSFENQNETIFYMDSELVVKQLNGLYKVKDKNLQKLFSEVKGLLSKINFDIKFKHVRRSENKIADSLVNKELDSRS